MLSDKDKQILYKLCQQKLTEQEAFEAKQDLLGFIELLLEVDKRKSPQNYKNKEN